MGAKGGYWIDPEGANRPGDDCSAPTEVERGEFDLDDQMGYLGFAFLDGRLTRRDAVK